MTMHTHDRAELLDHTMLLLYKIGEGTEPLDPGHPTLQQLAAALERGRKMPGFAAELTRRVAREGYSGNLSEIFDLAGGS